MKTQLFCLLVLFDLVVLRDIIFIIGGICIDTLRVVAEERSIAFFIVVERRKTGRDRLNHACMQASERAEIYIQTYTFIESYNSNAFITIYVQTNICESIHASYAYVAGGAELARVEYPTPLPQDESLDPASAVPPQPF